MSRKADIHTHKTTTHTHTLTCVHSIARTVILAQFNHGIWPVAAIDPEGVITVLGTVSDAGPHIYTSPQ